jgi:hypothetical protein
MARITKAASDPSIRLENIRWEKNGRISWQWKSRFFTAQCRRDGGIDLHVSDGESARTDSFNLEGALKPDFMLKCAQQSEQALTVQIRLKLFLEKKGIVVTPCPNIVVADQCVVQVGLDGSLFYKLDGVCYDAATKRSHDVIAEFQASKPTGALASDPAPSSEICVFVDLV